jgi:alpha-2-macroglobulin-like protein
MASCEQNQPQLLAYLYDLLETEERQALQTHLDQCAACQAALERAKRQQKLLATAAKAEFAKVKFAPPAVTVASRSEEPVLKMSATRRPWFGWALAASILVLLGLGAPAAWWTAQYRHEQRLALLAREQAQSELALVQAKTAQHDQEVARRGAEVQKLSEQINKLNVEHATNLSDVFVRLQNRQFNVYVTGPEAVQPGGRNLFKIQPLANGRPTAATLALRVIDKAHEKPLFEEKELRIAGTYSFLLPEDLDLKPDSEPVLEIVARRPNGDQAEIREKLSLVAPVYLTHLTTDKPMYRPGETVHFRSLTLERFSLKPAEENLHLIYTVADGQGAEKLRLDGSTQLHDAGNQPLLGPDRKPIRGVGAGDYLIPPESSGGEYTLTVSETHNRFPPQQRKFIVNKYRNPLMNKELDFTRKSYGPGEEVVAACKASRAENKEIAIANRPVTATMQIDGKAYGIDGKEGGPAFKGTTDAAGVVKVRFKLPAVIERGLGTLSVQFSDGANVESLVKPIPIALKKLDVEFFAEGGDLVAGVPNRVYFQARTMLGKPAELRGRIVDQDGKVVVTKVETLHDDEKPGVNQGMGAFRFTPEAGKSYELKIDVPPGMEGKHALPTTKADGVVLTVADAVSKAGQPIRVTVYSADKDRDLLIGAYCRGRLMDHQTVAAKQGEATSVELKPAGDAGGVYRITVFEELPGEGRRQLKPRAERLVYHTPSKQLILNAKPDKKLYVPGEQVTLSLSALDEKEQPAPAIVMVSVVDKSVITLADEKTYRTMPTHYFLTTEVRRPEDLEYADFLLSSHPKAAAALDLLLGTQGWRRFAEQKPEEFKKNQGAEADRLLATTGQATSRVVNVLQHQAEKLEQDYASQLAKLQEDQTKANQAAAQSDQDFTREIAALKQQVTQLEQERTAAEQRLADHKALGARVAASALPVAAVILLVLSGVTLVLGVRRDGLPRTLPRFALAAICLCLGIGLLVIMPALQPMAQDSLLLTRATGHSRSAMTPAPETASAVAKTAEPMAHDGPAAPLAKAAPGVAPAEMKDRAMDNLFGRVADGKGEGAPGMPNGVARFQLGMAQNKAAPPMPAQERLELLDATKEMKAAKEPLGRDKDMPLARAFRPQALAVEKAKEALLEQEAQQAGARRMLEAAPALREELREDRKRVADLMMKRGAGFGGGRVPAGGFGPAAAGLMPLVEPPPAPLVVREFAFHRSGGPSPERHLFADTIYWHPVLVLPDGKGQATFSLSDSVTGYETTVFGHTLDGRIGAFSTILEARNLLALEPKLPIEVTASDKIDVPVSIANNTNEQRPVEMHVAATGLKVIGDGNTQIVLGPGGRTRRVFRLQPDLVEGQGRVTIDGTTAPYQDRVTRTLTVVPDGFPIVSSRSDVLEGAAQQEVVLPETWIKGTLQCRLQVFPSTLADLQKGLEALLREPGGCFEQTSSSNYPNVLILNYLKESDQANNALKQRASQLLASGYQRLVAFECEDPQNPRRRGYEWFGGKAAPHEALTAYGLLEFRDMAGVYAVDMQMVERTRNYLMSRKDGKGGFQRNPAAIDTFGRAPDDITNAYIVWALTESGKDDDIEKELATLASQAKTSKDPYFIALVANSLINRARTEDGVTLLKAVAAAQKEDGHLDAAQTSITGSGGRDLQIETTALAVLGWLKANRPGDFNAPIQKAVKWISQQRGGYGGFGSTQSTILALKALIAFTRANKKTPEAGTLKLYVGDKMVGQQQFAAGVQDALVLDVPEAEKHLKPGKNAVRFEITGKNVFPYTLTSTYRTRKPASAEQCAVKLSTHLDRPQAVEGETVHLSVTVENAEDKGQGMAIAIIGLPSGLTLPEDMKQLKDYALLRNNGKDKGLIGAWEVRGRELVLYWRDLAPKQRIEVPLDLICQVPGEYTGPASRAYLYYNADHKHWVDPLKVTITPKEE